MSALFVLSEFDEEEIKGEERSGTMKEEGRLVSGRGGVLTRTLPERV